MQESCYASGARRGCAALAVANALGGADLIAVLAPAEAREGIARAVRWDLETRRGHRLLSVEAAGAAWLRGLASGGVSLRPGLLLDPAEATREDELARRAVLEWVDVDAFLVRHESRFEPVADFLCGALRRAGPGPAPPGLFHKAILIGGERLMAHLDHLARRAERLGFRFQYILVH